MFWLVLGIFSIMIATLFGVIGFLVHKIWFKPQNDPFKCIIFVKGVDRPYKGYKKRINKDSITYFYDNGKKFVLVPNTYGFDFHYYRRTIYLDSLGQIIATPQLKDKTLTDDEKYDVIYEALTSDIGYGAIRAIKPPKEIKNLVAIIVIVAVIVAIVAGGTGYMIKRPKTIIQNPSVPTENKTQTQELPPTNIIIEDTTK